MIQYLIPTLIVFYSNFLSEQKRISCFLPLLYRTLSCLQVVTSDHDQRPAFLLMHCNHHKLCDIFIQELVIGRLLTSCSRRTKTLHIDKMIKWLQQILQEKLYYNRFQKIEDRHSSSISTAHPCLLVDATL